MVKAVFIFIIIAFFVTGFTQTNFLHKQKIIDNTTDTFDTTKYAVLYLYRPRNPVGALVGYKINMDDSVIYKLKNNGKAAIKIYKEGVAKIWPGTYTKQAVSLHVKFGEEYFLKFVQVSGLVGATPQLNIMNAEQGKIEYEACKER